MMRRAFFALCQGNILMNRQIIRISQLLLLLCLLTLALRNGAEPTSAAPARQSNLLNNPSFEEPYSSGTAQNWSPWHQELNSNPKPANCSDRYAVRPTWSPEYNGSIILDGGRSQHVGNQFDTWRAGVMQTINVNPGSTYRFAFWGTGRASNDQYPVPSDTAVNLGIRGGIDPNGSGVWSDGDVVWGGSGSPHMSGGSGNWQQFFVEATATGNQMTVFVQGDTSGANQCRAHIDVWFDKAELVEAGPAPTNTPPPPPPPPPQPVVTNTPLPPTATATLAIPPTATPAPTKTPTNTPEPPKGGVICVNAFADSNGNGVRDADEGYMAGVTFTVAQGDQVVANGVSTGSSTAICFATIPAGTYIVAQQVPRNVEMTTAQNATVDVTDGSTISLEFGSRVETDGSGEAIGQVTPGSGEGQSPDQGGDGSSNDSGPSPLAFIGLAAILVAVVLLVVLIVVLLRQSKPSES